MDCFASRGGSRRSTPRVDPFAVAVVVPHVHADPADRGVPLAAGSRCSRAAGAERPAGARGHSTTTSTASTPLARAGCRSPWSDNDVLAVAALIGSVFGKGGGDEARRSAAAVGAAAAARGCDAVQVLWNDLRELQDPEAPVTLATEFEYGEPPQQPQGQRGHRRRQPRSAAAQALCRARAGPRRSASNALLIGANRSATGHPLFVAGPQVGLLLSRRC